MENIQSKQRGTHHSGKRLLHTLGFILLGLAILMPVQRVLTPKWTYPIQPPMMALEQGVRTQVLFLGSSQIYSDISPMEIYEEYKITSLALSTPRQQMALSYDLLLEVLKSWTPQVVVLEISSLIIGQAAEAIDYWGLMLAQTPLSAFKLKDAWSYTENAVEEGSGNGFQRELFGALCPLYHFHSRWCELNAGDFAPVDSNTFTSYSMGFWVTPQVQKSKETVDTMNAVAAAMNASSVLRVDQFVDGQKEAVVSEADVLYDPQLSRINVLYFEKIVQLCNEKGIALQLIKCPSIGNPVGDQDRKPWTWQLHAMMEKLTQARGVPFLDLLYDEELGIDWQNDTFDAGMHLNVRGAKKVSHYLGGYLKFAYQLPEVSDPFYEEALPFYRQTEQLAMQLTEPELSSWIDRVLCSDRDLTVLLAACEDMSLGLTREHIQALQRIGLQTDFSGLTFGDTFVAVWEHHMDGGNSIPYEAVSNRELSYHYETPEGVKMDLISRGGYQYGDVSVKVKDTEQAVVCRGLHLIVFDRQADAVVDGMCVDFSAAEGGLVTHFAPAQRFFSFYYALNCNS